jgi:hypothetical protein
MSDQMKFDTHQALTVGRAGSLANILVMTEEMLESARNDQWDDVTEMEELRRQALSECFGAPIPEEYSELFTEALAAMLHMNEELILLLENAKTEVAIKRTDQARTSKSLGHYLDIENTH